MSLRTENAEKLAGENFDVLVLGGGINGAVAAAALAGKGLKVALIEAGDFAGCTSSNSSNLAWGGIKYLESGEFLLVNRLCRSRNHLMRHYPSSVREVRFLATVRKDFRLPAFATYMGALFYWLIGACFTRPPRYLSPAAIRREEPAVSMDQVTGGVEYSDCYLPDNDARFVFRFLRTAMGSGCAAANYVEALDSTFSDGGWQTQARDLVDGRPLTIRSRILVNACGPYVDGYNRHIGQQTRHRHLFSKGIHLIVDRVTRDERVLAFFASDGRLFFVIPMGPKTCIGTTDTPVDSPSVQVTAEDRQFVLDNANALLALAKPLTRNDIIAERCGVRPLAVTGDNQSDSADWLKLSRRHAIDSDPERQFISIFGGKLTDCLNVGEEVVDRVQAMGLDVPNRDRIWYGEPTAALKRAFLSKAAAMSIDNTRTLSGEALPERIWRRYGEYAYELLEDIAADPQRALRKPVEDIDYTCCELALMARTEMIVTLDDFLRRRSKIAQVLRPEQIVDHPGLMEVCDILFGSRASEKREEYVRQQAEVAD